MRFDFVGLPGILECSVVVYKPFSRQIIEDFYVTDNAETIHQRENAAKAICKDFLSNTEYSI